jgi:hypothetical protein
MPPLNVRLYHHSTLETPLAKVAKSLLSSFPLSSLSEDAAFTPDIFDTDLSSHGIFPGVLVKQP